MREAVAVWVRGVLVGVAANELRAFNAVEQREGQAFRWEEFTTDAGKHWMAQGFDAVVRETQAL